MRIYFKTLFFLILFLFTLSQNIFAQCKKIHDPRIKTEGNYYIKNGTIYTDAIVVKFNYPVIEYSNKTNAEIKDIGLSYTNFIKKISDFEDNYGPIKFIKQIPNAKWGETISKNKISGELVKTEDFSQLFTFQFSNPVPLDSSINALNKVPEIEYAHNPVSVYYYSEPPDDPIYESGNQWNLEKVNALDAWDITKGNSIIKIAVIDEGININHDDLTSKIQGGNAYNGEHGTWVSGVAGAVTDNDDGVASLGWYNSIYNYGDEWENSSLASRILEASDSTDIINMSFGTLRPATMRDMELCPDCPDPEKWINLGLWMPDDHPAVRSACSTAVAKGVICVASAGNMSKNIVTGVSVECDPIIIPFHSYPAEYSGVLAVSGSLMDDGVEECVGNWNYGDFVDISAPGVDIWTTDWGGSYTQVNGTSFSAPLVSALVSLIKAINYDLTVNQIRNILINSTDKISPADCPDMPYYDANGWNKCLGYGRINAFKAVLEAEHGTWYHAYRNKSYVSSATYANGARHLVQGGSYLHEVFTTTDGMIFYRRSDDNGQNWQITKRITGELNDNRSACLLYKDGKIHAVWQRALGSYQYEVYYANTDAQSIAWSDPFLLSAVTTTSLQAGAMPVISYTDSPDKLVAVYCTNSGLYAKTSSNNGQTWSSAVQVESSNRVRFPSMTYNDFYNKIHLLYDLRTSDGVYSRTYDGSSWSSSVWASGSTSTKYNREPSVAYDPAQILACWRGQLWNPSTGLDPYYSLIVRKGYFNNTWDSWFTVIPHPYQVSHYGPSITRYYPTGTGSNYGIGIVNGTSDNTIHLHRYFLDDTQWIWDDQTIHSNGNHANITDQGGSTSDPLFFYTDLSTVPYPVTLEELSGSPLFKTTSDNSISSDSKLIHKRRGVIYDKSTDSELVIEVNPLCLKFKDGTTKIIAFKEHSLTDTIKIDLANMGAYLGSENFTIPSSGDSIIFSQNSFGYSGSDSSGKALPTSFSAQYDLSLQVIESDSKNILRESDISRQNITSISVAEYASSDIFLTVKFDLGNQDSENFEYSVGDVYSYASDKDAELRKKAAQNLIQPESFCIKSIFPNPFNPTTTIQFEAPEAAHVTINIYTTSGEKIATLLSGSVEPGSYTTIWQGKDSKGNSLASGVYFVNLIAENENALVKENKKVILLK